MAKAKRTTHKTRNDATASPQLAFHPTARLPLHRLPFVGMGPDDSGISFWNVHEQVVTAADV